jgi:SAM-dependent methyltransferase
MDLHSHIRYRVTKKFLKDFSKNVEVGAGIGLMSFQFVLNFKKPILVLTYTDYEYTQALFIVKQVEWLQKYAKVKKDDAQILACCPSNFFEQALIIDVLEHVYDDHEAIKQLYRILKPGGRVILSVPTPYYPFYFGYKMDKEIGHLRHYTLHGIRNLFEKFGFTYVAWQPYTFKLTGILCNIFYVKITNWIIRAFIMPFLLVLSFVTEKIFNDIIFAEMIVVFRKGP